MGHEIETLKDTVVLGSNLPAWHGLGKLFAGLLSPLRAYAEGVGAREILEEEVQTGGLVIPGYKALVAVNSEGLKNPLSVVGESYGVLQDSEFFNILEKVYGGRACVETAGTLRGGKRIWALVKGDTFDVVKGDTINSFDLWVNRHDGSGCFELHNTKIRVVCANTWRQAIGKGKNRVFGVRHTSGIAYAAKTAAQLAIDTKAQDLVARQSLVMMANTRITVDAARKTFTNLFVDDVNEKLTARTRNQVDDMVTLFREGTGNEGRTRWDAFNAVTEFVDHYRGTRVTEGRDENEVVFETSIFGTGDDIKAKAFDLLAN